MNVFLLDSPKVFITPEAMEDLRLLTEICETEIAMIGKTEVISTEGNTTKYLVSDIMVPGQEVSGVDADITPEGFQEIATEIIGRGLGLQDYRFHCHSHVNMPVSPSNDDEEDFKKRYMENNEHSIRAIINKKGKIRVDLADRKRDIVYKDIGITVLTNGSKSKQDWEKIVETNLKPKRVAATHITSYSSIKNRSNKSSKDRYNKSVMEQLKELEDTCDGCGLITKEQLYYSPTTMSFFCSKCFFDHEGVQPTSDNLAPSFYGGA